MALASKMPIQIGMAFFSSRSFRMTIGVLVIGSIVRPDTFISMNICASSFLHLAPQGMGEGILVPHVTLFADESVSPQEMNDPVSPRPPGHLLAPVSVRPLDQNRLPSSDAGTVFLQRMRRLESLERHQPFPFHTLAYGPIHPDGGRPFPFRVLEREEVIKTDLPHQFQRLLKILLLLPRESHDHIGGDADLRTDPSKQGHLLPVCFGRIA